MAKAVIRVGVETARRFHVRDHVVHGLDVLQGE